MATKGKSIEAVDVNFIKSLSVCDVMETDGLFLGMASTSLAWVVTKIDAEKGMVFFHVHYFDVRLVGVACKVDGDKMIWMEMKQ